MTDSADSLLAQVSEPLTTRQRSRLQRLGALLEKQREQVAVAVRRLAEEATANARRQYAAELESKYLDKGIDATVHATGRNATTLQIIWFAATRLDAHAMGQDSELLALLQSLGFRRRELWGYDQSWYWRLD